MSSETTQPPVSPEHLYTWADGVRYTRKVNLYTILIYAHFGVCLVGFTPLWTLCLSAPVLVVRWMLSLHELFHLRHADDLDPFTGMLPLVITPLFIGYGEYRDIHMGHHAHMATPQDPDYFHIRGNPLSGLINAFTAPEQIFFRWVATHPLDTRFVLGVLVRLSLFTALVAIAGWDFLWYLIPMRVAHGLSYFSFFYCLHRRGGDYGVYPLALPKPVESTLGILFGPDAVQATCHHDVHHHHAGIAGIHLPAYSVRIGRNAA